MRHWWNPITERWEDDNGHPIPGVPHPNAMKKTPPPRDDDDHTPQKSDSRTHVNQRSTIHSMTSGPTHRSPMETELLLERLLLERHEGAS